MQLALSRLVDFASTIALLAQMAVLYRLRYGAIGESQPRLQPVIVDDAAPVTAA